MKRSLLIFALAAATTFALADTAGGLKWNVPPAWKAQAQRPMRAATYTAPKAANDPEDGECAVFYFGPGQGGGVDANIKRWIGQFEAPAGGPADKLAKTSKATVNGLPVTRIDLTGTYKPAGGPMMQASGSKPGYRLLGAIVEGPQGAVFFKLTAPVKTAAAQQAAFEALLKSVSR
ncbi:MAG: hypothetical protein HY235_21985 [Acidobacteria bacterium]|nr:hypothetical protein [Acidobacteriota bacterium]